ncbi:MAG: hypothetical protein M1840_009086 [Geoglossum simile]|nr:MAG: hypothetical protein M1840_009086 [Geoglossum simile]
MAIWKKALPLFGSYDGQTVGGVFNTGTHGPVIIRGPMVEIIVSIGLVRAGGRLIRLEPAGGIVDPAAFTKEHPGLELVQDDDYYHAALINMGAMGAVHSYMLEITDAFHLKEETQKIWKPFHPESPMGKTDGGFKDHPFSAYHFEFLINPDSDSVIITSRHPIAVDNDSAFSFDPPGRDLIYTIHLGARFSRP